MGIKDNYRNVFIIIVIILFICLVTGIYSLSQYTLVRFCIPFICFVTMSLFASLFLGKAGIWGRVTGSMKYLPNYLCCFVCTCILGLSLFYICNYAFANDEKGEIRNVVVEEKYQKVRHKSRRVGRNRYVRGEAYNVYYMRVRLNDEQIKEFPIEQGKYARLHKGDTIPLFVSKGLLGVPVVKYNRISKYTNGSSYRNQFKN